MLVNDIVILLEKELLTYKVFKRKLRLLIVSTAIVTIIFAAALCVLIQFYLPYFLYPSTDTLLPLASMIGYAAVFMISLPIAFQKRAGKYRERALAEGRVRLMEIGNQGEVAAARSYIESTRDLMSSPLDEKGLSNFVEQTYPILTTRIQEVCNVLRTDSKEIFKCSNLALQLREFKQSFLESIEKAGRTNTKALAEKLEIQKTLLRRLIQSAVDAHLFEGYLTEDEFITKEKLREELQKEMDS